MADKIAVDIEKPAPRIRAMPNNTFVKVLVFALTLVAAGDLFFAVHYNLTYLKLHRMQPQLMTATNLRGQVNQLVTILGGELVEYSKKNPSIDPLLMQYGFKATPTNAPGARPPQR